MSFLLTTFGCVNLSAPIGNRFCVDGSDKSTDSYDDASKDNNDNNDPPVCALHVPMTTILAHQGYE